MITSKFRYILVGLGFTIVTIALFTLVELPNQDLAGDNIIHLKAPPFVESARAENSAIGDFLDEEAGVAAWVEVDPIDLNDIKNLPDFNLEYETPEYIIGSINIPNYSEAEDVHIYANVDGWLMAYYMNSYPAAKSIDTIFFRSNGLIRTKLRVALEIVAAAAGTGFSNENYYDFRFPNATNMMTVAETDLDGGENSFIIELPSSYIFFERSYSIYGNGDGAVAINTMRIDGNEIRRCYPYCYGTISSSVLSVDVEHTVSVSDEGTITLIYQEQQ